MKGCRPAIVVGMIDRTEDGGYKRVSGVIGKDGKPGGSAFGNSLDFMAPGYNM